MNLGTRVENQRERELKHDALTKAMALPRDAFYSLAAGPPMKFGMTKREMRIEEVLSTGRIPGMDRRMDYSGGHGRYSGTSRNSLGGP